MTYRKIISVLDIRLKMRFNSRNQEIKCRLILRRFCVEKKKMDLSGDTYSCKIVDNLKTDKFVSNCLSIKCSICIKARNGIYNIFFYFVQHYVWVEDKIRINDPKRAFTSQKNSSSQWFPSKYYCELIGITNIFNWYIANTNWPN